MVVPQWFQHMNAEDMHRLENQIAAIEAKSDVEIVPVIVRSSSRYPQTKVTLALLFTVVFAVLWDILDMEIFWDQGLEAAIFASAYLVFVFVLAPWISGWGRVQMWLTHRESEFEHCFQRSEAEFHSGKISQTARKNGVLIYISLLEHVVIIKGDEAVYKNISEEKWQEAVDVLLAGIRKKQMAQGISDALKVMESLLVTHFPLTSGKANEVPNTFIIKE